MAFDATAVAQLYSQVQSRAQDLGDFEQVIPHEPKSAPVSLPALAVWWADIAPARGVSGLVSTSVRCEFKGRVYLAWRGKPEDTVEQELLYLTALVLGAYSADFTLGGEVMEVDLLGAYGTALSASGGYVIHDDQQFRASEVVIPVILDGIWSQVP